METAFIQVLDLGSKAQLDKVSKSMGGNWGHFKAEKMN